MKLEDLQPKRSSFYLSAFDKEFYLKPFNLEDEIWLKQEYGERVNEFFNHLNPDFHELCRVIYRKLEDKSEFKTREFIEVDEEGNENSIKLGGVDALKRSIIGQKEKYDVFYALNECIGVSRPQLEQVDKKKAKKKKAKKKQTGRK